MMKLRLAAVTMMVIAMSSPAAAEPILLHAAGSLRTALTAVATAYQAATGQQVQAKFGPSGILKDEIVSGAPAAVFASANMDHPRALATAGARTSRQGSRPHRSCATPRPNSTAGVPPS